MIFIFVKFVDELLNPSLTIWSHSDFTYTRVQEFNNVLSDETHCLSNIEKDNKGIILLFCIIKIYYYIENGEMTAHIGRVCK